MAFQTIDGVYVFLVTITEPPITILPIINDLGPDMQPYAEALDTAIRWGFVTKPGKYGIEVKHDDFKRWNVYQINE